MSEMEFDAVAADYREILDRAILISGENSRYFAEQRVHILRGILGRRVGDCRSIVDYGCGTGIGVDFLKDQLRPERIVGMDVSQKSLELAAATYQADSIEFQHVDDHQPQSDVDLVFSNGVIHHIAPDDRADVFLRIHAMLRPGGVCAIWENNPWSLPARYCMKVNAFDRHAQMVSARAVRRLFVSSGLRPISTSYHFVFPRLLAKLRPLEPSVRWMPMGAQYVVLATRPELDFRRSRTKATT